MDTENSARRRGRQMFWLQILGIWLLVSTAFIAPHFKYYFQEAYYESGDDAANALQIRRAKVGQELYGNYSRWKFHHPGPAFFYAYAAGERLFFDSLKIVPAPYNAHALTGVLLQAFFFAWALAIAARHARSPLLVPLLLLLAGAHFGVVNQNIPDSAFESIWPPHVLLFPFLCFLVAAASVAVGETDDLVAMLVAGGTLVHGHVAQPLFVVPLAAIAYAMLCRRHRSILEPFRFAPVAHGWGAFVLLLFTFPLLVDAFRGEQSNLRVILDHFSQHAEDRKTWLQSLAYFASFFCYLPHPHKICDELSHATVAVLSSRWPYFLMWSVVGSATVLLARFRRETHAAAGRKFFRSLAFFWTIACLLTLVWGTLQNGEMFGFNSYFNFALLFVPWMLLALAFVGLPRFSTPSLRGVVYVIAFFLLAFASKEFSWSSDFPSRPSDTKRLVEQVRLAVAQDQQAPRTKFLLFEHEQWPLAMSAALTLERLGYDYRVSPEWAYMFDAQRGAAPTKALANGETALWRIEAPAGKQDNWIFASPPAVDPTGAEISFSGSNPNAGRFVVSGWEVTGGPFSWSTAQTALLCFTALPAASDVEIEMDVFPSDFSPTKTQRVSVSWNGAEAQHFLVDQNSPITYRVPADTWNRQPFVALTFEFPDAVSPQALGLSADARLLGCKFRRLVFHPTAGAPLAP